MGHKEIKKKLMDIWFELLVVTRQTSKRSDGKEILGR
jgi:hypothetical protein